MEDILAVLEILAFIICIILMIVVIIRRSITRKLVLVFAIYAVILILIALANAVKNDLFFDWLRVIFLTIMISFFLGKVTR